MKRKRSLSANYLAQVPARQEKIRWSRDGEGKVTLETDNTGWANRLAQICFRRPRVSYIHLDATGSFLWPLLDGKRDLTELGKLVEARFGSDAYPLYERLAKYFQILHSYRLIVWVKQETL